jgi:uncharacterized membrane protein YqhA
LDERAEHKAVQGETAPKPRRWQDHPLLTAMAGIIRIVTIIPVVATFVAAVALMVYGAIDTWHFVQSLYFSGHAPDREEGMLTAIEIVDLFLLATVVEVVSLGLYQLYFNQDLDVPKWLKIETLDDLKSKLVGVTVTVMAVSFLGRVIVGANGPDILYLGGGVALVIAALSFFLSKIDRD